MKTNKLFANLLFGVLPGTAAASPALFAADEEAGRHEVTVQGTGFFTKNSQGNGITQHSTDTGGLLASYRFHFNSWLAAEATYGYDRNTLQNFTSAGPFNIQSNVHQATGALVVTLPYHISRLRPYVLAGAGALVFDPTGKAGGFVPGAGRQAKAAFVYGGGADIAIVQRHLHTPGISFVLEYRGLVYKRPDFGISAVNSDLVAHTAQPSAGIAFRF